MGAIVRFLITVIWGNRLNCWKTIPIFRLCRLISFFLSVISTPSKRIVPSVGSSSRLRQRRNVLLPEPEGPTTNTTSPRRISVETPHKAWFSIPSNFFFRPSTLIRTSLSRDLVVTVPQPPFKLSHKKFQ